MGEIILTIKESILTLLPKNGDVLNVVTFEQGGLGVTRNGIHIRYLYWPNSEAQDIHACVAAAKDLAQSNCDV